MSRKATPGAGGPRLDTFKRPSDSLSPDDMRVKSKPAGGMSPGGPSVAPNETAGRVDPGFGPPKKRPLFNQKYWQKSTPHADYLHGNPDSRRNIGDLG
jgi:hypothetical protein